MLRGSMLDMIWVGRDSMRGHCGTIMDILPGCQCWLEGRCAVDRGFYYHGFVLVIGERFFVVCLVFGLIKHMRNGTKVHCCSVDNCVYSDD